MMNKYCQLALVIIVLCVIPVAAQWPDYPTAGVPRLPNGKPNLSAAAPRGADGKPDLSGMWQVEDSGLVNGFAWNVAQNLEAGDVQPWARALFRERILNLGKDAPMARCLPRGLPIYNAFPAALARIVQTPALVMIVYGGEGTNTALRTIFTDGRALPDNPEPAWLGYSIGHWQDDTLVVNTSGFNDRTWLDFDGHPQTESLRITERYRRRDVGHMEYEMTIDDPKEFARPFSMKMDKVLVPDTELTESICENERDAVHLVGGSAPSISPADLSTYAGTYAFATGREATIREVDGLLFFREGANGIERVLVPQSETLFVFRDNGDTIQFVKEPQGVINRFVTAGGSNGRTAVRTQAP